MASQSFKTTTSGIPNFKLHTNILQAVTGMSLAMFKKERIFKIKMGPQTYYILFDPKYVEELLKNNKMIDKPYSDFRFFGPWLGDGILMASGSKWRANRKLLGPAFHFQILDTYQPIMNEKSRILVEKLRTIVGQDTIKLSTMVELCTMDIICETAMGYQCNAQDNGSVEFVKSLHNLCELMIPRITNPLLRIDAIWNLTPQGRLFNKSNKHIQDLVRDIIKRRKEEYISLNGNVGERPVFIDILFKQQETNKGFSDEALLDEVNTFMFTGQDTTSVAITWILFLLGHHPEIQDKAAQELFEIFGENHDRDVTMDDIKQLKYMDLIIKEGQRLYPSAPIIARDINEDFSLGDGIVIPKGSITWTLLGVLSMNEENFPNHLRFDPERFNVENSKDRNPFAAVPFSAGPRNCIGQRFAMLSMKTVLANILRNFKVVSLDARDRIAISPELVARPSKKISFRLENRVAS